MGCDIHIFIERATRYNDEPDEQLLWLGFGYDVRASRDYEMFGAIAGVRDQDIERIDDPRGFPPDYSEWQRTEMDKHYFHSWTYLTPDEFEEAIFRAMQRDQYERHDYTAILRFCRDLESSGDKVRLVIGFDS